METILVFAAHADDEAIGVGGTIAKYVKEGKKVITIIASNGGGSSPWLKKDILINERIKEVEEIGEFLGTSKIISLNLTDGKISGETNLVVKKVAKIITKYKPTMIFTHSRYDPHPDHKGVNKFTFDALKIADPGQKIQVFVYEVWNVLNETHPTMYVNITKTFNKKIRAIKMFKSQKQFTYPLLFPVYFRAIISGFHNKCRFAERFYKIR